MVNTPIPHSLKSECRKAAKILREFTFPSAKSGPDKFIPAGILAKAKGLAILTVIKAGFLVTARGGSGIVIAKLQGGYDDFLTTGWSAPSAIGIAGLGGGFEIGAEVTDFVIILNTRSAVEAFSKGGNLTLGGNFTIAAGPLGRNVEGDIAVRSPAAIYTYSRTKGIFAGISIEGSALIERKDANRKFYGQDIRACSILNGDVDPPPECAALYEVLDQHRKEAAKAVLKMAKDQARKHGRTEERSFTESFQSLFGKSEGRIVSTKTVTTRTVTSSDSSGKVISKKTVRSSLAGNSSESNPSPARTFHLGKVCHAVALAAYTAQLPCDLTFNIGDHIEVLTKTDSEFDWWEGACHDKIGIFPANYVKIVEG